MMPIAVFERSGEEDISINLLIQPNAWKGLHDFCHCYHYRYYETFYEKTEDVCKQENMQTVGVWIWFQKELALFVVYTTVEYQDVKI